MEENVYKIYLIEDHAARVSGVHKYFDSSNRLLSGAAYNPDIDYKDSHMVFKDNGIDKIEVIHIIPSQEKNGYYNYNFNDQNKWVKKLKETLKNEEKRVFLIDLALNSKERKDFDKNQETFRAITARKILDLLAQYEKKEDIIIESIYGRIDDDYKRILDYTSNENLNEIFNKVGTIRGNLFAPSSDAFYSVQYITLAFKYIFNIGGDDL